MSLSSRMCRCAAALCVFAGLFQGATASAQSAPTVSNLKSTIDLGWDLHPAMNGNTLVGFLAMQVSGSPAPNGYTILWLQRTATNTFAMKGYSGVNLDDAAKKLEISLAQAELFTHTEFSALVYDGEPDTEPAATFTDMPNGLAITDPLQEVAGDLPPEIMELAVELGSEGAITLSAASVSATNACNAGTGIDQILSMLTQQIEGIIVSDGQYVPSVEPTVLFGCCFPRTIVSEFTMPNVGGWTSTNPSGTTCTYTRPTTRYRHVTSVNSLCNITIWTTILGPGTPQNGSCPNINGPCPAVPACTPL